MKKLNPDQLVVDTFATERESERRGTVVAHAWSESLACAESEQVSCGGSCGQTACSDRTCRPCPVTSAGTCGCVTSAQTCAETGPHPYGTCCFVGC